MVIPYCKPVSGSNPEERALFKWRFLINKVKLLKSTEETKKHRNMESQYEINSYL